MNNIRIARVDATTGAVSNEIAVAAGANEQYWPNVSCISATNCLVTWNEWIGTNPSIVRGSIVNPSAGSAAAAQTLSNTLTVDQFAAAPTNNGANYYVAWWVELWQDPALDPTGDNVEQPNRG